MGRRKLKYGKRKTAPEYIHPVDITISTKCPQKWRFVDLETGEVYEWVNGLVRQADPDVHLTR